MELSPRRTIPPPKFPIPAWPKFRKIAAIDFHFEIKRISAAPQRRRNKARPARLLTET
jgi:hypothetical protein